MPTTAVQGFGTIIGSKTPKLALKSLQFSGAEKHFLKIIQTKKLNIPMERALGEDIREF